MWGNGRDGFNVNDVYSGGVVYIRCKREIHNKGTPHEFSSYHPTDLQLSRAVGGKNLSWDGESDFILYAERSSNGKPVCELRFIENVNERSYRAKKDLS